MRVKLDGQALDVDHFLTLADGLGEEAKTFVKRGGGNTGAAMTPEQLAHALKMASNQTASRDDVSMSNPAIFAPAWKGLLDSLYMGGSKSRTLRALCAKAWVRSQGTLTKGDLWTLYREMDAHFGGYCVRTYGYQACDRDISSAMQAVGSEPSEPKLTREELNNQRLQKEMARMAKRRA